MRRSVRILLYIALGIVALIVGAVLFYKGVFPTYSYRYSMTVEVTVDGVVHSGSSVIEVDLVKQPRIITDTPAVLPKVHGEAVFVDLGKGRNVIALLASGLERQQRRLSVVCCVSAFQAVDGRLLGFDKIFRPARQLGPAG